MKVIFLDVDGVLSNSQCCLHTIEPSKAVYLKKSKEDEGQYPLEIRCLKLLLEIVKETGVKKFN